MSKALCLPTSSRVAITVPTSSINTLAWIPPVFANSDCSFINRLGDFKIISSFIFGKCESNLSFFNTSIESNEVFPHTPHEEFVTKFLFNLPISKLSVLFIVASITLCKL